VISFVEKRYATKVGTVAEGDHLIFFLNEHPPADDSRCRTHMFWPSGRRMTSSRKSGGCAAREVDRQQPRAFQLAPHARLEPIERE